MVRARLVVGLGVLAVALAGCGGASSAGRSAQPPAAPAARGSVVAKASPTSAPRGELVQVGQVSYANWGERDARGERRRGVDAGDYYFKGTFFQGDPGQTLTLEINNVAGQVHNISIPSQGVDQDIPPDSARVNVDVTFPTSGELQFFCKYHTSRGMNGLLLVGHATPELLTSPEPVASPRPATSPSVLPVGSPRAEG